MDIEQAKNLLRSFRPDGADAHDASFKEALQLAIEHRELGEWLAVERARDAAFSEALGRIEIPEELREGIFNVLFSEKGQEMEIDLFDQSFVDALSDIAPPPELRGQILQTMELETSEKVVNFPVKEDANSSRRRSKAPWLAAAAAVVLGIFTALQVSLPSQSDRKALLAGADSFPSVQAAAQKFLDGRVSLDVKSKDPVKLASWLGEQELPTPTAIPEKLKGLASIGCKELNIGGKPASLVCFMMDSNKVVHMIVMDDVAQEEVSIPLEQAKNHCQDCPVSDWASTSWKEEEKTYMLLSKIPAEELSQVF